MKISKNYQRAIEICDTYREFKILEYIKGKSPKLKLECLNCGNTFERYQCHFIQYPHVCPRCHPKGSSQFITVEEAQKRIDDIYGKERLILINYNGNNTLANVKCSQCDFIFKSVPTSLWRGRIKGCPQCEKSNSIGEARIEKFLRENKIQYQPQYRFPDCRDKLSLPFDFYLLQYNTCIEFQGEQHYKEKSMFYSEELIKHDEIKRQYCKKNNIKLIEIPYTDIDNIENILCSFKSN